MIYVTGDLHGDIERFKSKAMKKLRKGDYLIVCGDFGFVWDGSKKEKKLLKWLGRRRYHLLFIEGTHDNLDLISEYPEADWCGGKVREISGKLRQLVRGSVYELDGKKVFAFGGGESVDNDLRKQGESWWVDELPDLNEIALAKQALEQCGNVVDYIVSHDCSGRVKGFIDMDSNNRNHLHAFFDQISTTVRFKHWYFGHYHMDKVISPSCTGVFKNVVRLP